MADYIDRQAAIDALILLQDHSDMPEDWHKGVSASLSCLYRVPTVQPERKKGKWNRTELYPHRIYCSVCYKTYIKNDELLERWEFPMNYCPNCGAEMVGET